MIKEVDKSIFTIHFLFWVVYFCFFLYQLHPQLIENDHHFRGKPKMMPLPPTHDITENNHEFKIDFDKKIKRPTFLTVLSDVVIHVLLMMLLAYLNYFYLLPRFLNKKLNRMEYLIQISLVFMSCITILIFLKSLMRGELFDFENSMFYRYSFIFELSLSALFILFFVSLIKFVENYVEVEAQKKEIENQQLRTELMVLKSQINPHFLFNAFNNLYALAIQNSTKTPDTIDKLSQIMRYSLYESGKSEVTLQKEIELIDNIIQLEKLHLGNDGMISFHKIPPEKANQIKIAPMILVTFLENAFKHGAKGAMTAVEINLSLMDNTLIYAVKNRKELQVQTTEASGIGLKNVKRQLEIFYKNKHELTINEDDNFYAILLKINIL